MAGQSRADAEKTSEQKLDEALALTFPASDPPVQTQPFVHVGIKTAERTKSGRDRRFPSH